MQNYNKVAGWALCVASLLLLACAGKLDLLIVLLPLSAVLTIFSAAISRKDNSAGNGKKGIA